MGVGCMCDAPRSLAMSLALGTRGTRRGSAGFFSHSLSLSRPFFFLFRLR